MNGCNRVLKATKLTNASRTRELISSQKLDFQNFQWIANSVFKKGKSAILSESNGAKVLSSFSNKTKLFAEIFPKNYNLDNSDISLAFYT